MSSAETKKRPRVVKTALLSLLLFVGLLAAFGTAWLFRTWANLNMEQLVFHLNTELEGVSGEYVRSFLLSVLLPSLLSCAVTVLALIRTGRERLLWKTVLLLSPALLLLSLCYINSRLGALHYFSDREKYSETVDENYVSPSDVSIRFPEKKRNLIYIFLESVEITFADKESGGAFETNVIPELTALAQEFEDFSGLSKQLNGALATRGSGWTAAAMFAHSSGLPMPSSIGNGIKAQEGRLFPQVIALGDLLEEEGYQQTLLLGSKGSFGGRDYYYESHGNFTVKDYPYYLKNGSLPKDYQVWWGFEDARLFDFAKEELLSLSQSEQPFNLTLLTVDTHFEDGYICPDCQEDFPGDQYANVMACSSRRVAAFVRWVQKQPFYENTTIVIVGDHPTMDSDFCSAVDKAYRRRALTVFINSAAVPQRLDARVYTSFDLYPTTLAALGAEIEGDRLGLGVNLFSRLPTLAEALGYESFNQSLGMRSRVLDELTAYEPPEEKPGTN